MAEKGKGFTGGKAALKSSAGKDDSSAKSKKGKRVQFDPEEFMEPGSPNLNEREDVLPTTGGWAKSGKGDKVVNGTKKPVGKAPPEDRSLEQELPKNSTFIMDCEASEILQSIQDRMILLSQDLEIKLPVSFDLGLEYAKRGGNKASSQTVKKILELLKKYGVSDCQICQIANLCPESADEVFGLIPELMPMMNVLKDPLRIALNELTRLKEALTEL